MRRIVLIIPLLAPFAAMGATNNVTAGVVWEVHDTGGADTNGGGFDSANQGGTGIDHTNGAIVTASGNVSCISNVSTTITATGNPWDNTLLGNVVQISGGTNITAGFYTVTGFTDTNNLVVNQTICSGASAGSGATAVIGGPIATISKAETGVVAGNIVYVKDTGTHYSTSASINIATAGAAGTPILWIGFQSTRGDGLPASIVPSVSNLTNGSINSTGAFNSFYNFIIDNGAHTGSRGIGLAPSNVLYNTKVINAGTNGVFVSSSASSVTVQGVYVTGMLSGGTAGINCNASCLVKDSVVQGGSVTAFDDTSGSSVTLWDHDICDSPAGATSDCFQSGSTGLTVILNSVAYNAGRHGINKTAGSAVLRNNILDSNGQTSGTGYGISYATAWPSIWAQDIDYNAYYNNKTGTRSNIPAGAVTLTLTADPFTNPGNHDFSLNSTSGGGASLKATGFPGAFVSSATTGYMDIGAAQSQSAGGGQKAYGCVY